MQGKLKILCDDCDLDAIHVYQSYEQRIFGEKYERIEVTDSTFFIAQVSKSKTWKDVAGLLGIGASSSAAYTLRKHYTKNILPFECQFDRGGIDPGPIAQSIETGSKKKAAKAASVPSPGKF